MGLERKIKGFGHNSKINFPSTPFPSRRHCTRLFYPEVVTSPTEEKKNSSYFLAISVVWVMAGETHFSLTALKSTEAGPLWLQEGKLLKKWQVRISKDINEIEFSRKSTQELLGVQHPGISLLGSLAPQTLWVLNSQLF